MVDGLSPPRALELAGESGGVVVDVRFQRDFARSHPQGALSLPYSDRGLAERLATVLDPATPVVLIAGLPDQRDAAVAQLHAGGFTVLGFVRGGFSGWNDAYLPIARFAEVRPPQLADGARAPDMTVLDVREPMEWETGHVPGAVLIPLGELRRRLDELPRSGPIAVICEAGIRSSTAASVLEGAGFSELLNAPDGTAGFRKAGLPMQYTGAEDS
jgi:hydroxyacylglutathione hydrolase